MTPVLLAVSERLAVNVDLKRDLGVVLWILDEIRYGHHPDSRQWQRRQYGVYESLLRRQRLFHFGLLRQIGRNVTALRPHLIFRMIPDFDRDLTELLFRLFDCGVIGQSVIDLIVVQGPS